MSDNDEISVRSKSKRKKRTQTKAVLFWAGECWYSVVKETVQKMGWNSSIEESAQQKANMFWIDRSKMLEFYEIMQPWQTINHFPGMPNIANKNKMGQNLNRMLKLFPKEYSFYPRTWILPNQMSDFRNQFDNHNNALDNKIYIVKPDTGCQGRGIFLTRTLDKIPLGENVVAQTYIGNPLLVDGYKFDLRIYVFVASIKPLRVYLFQDGLVRMCTEEYVKPNKQNIDMNCMHLTNYAVNKKNDNFQQPDTDGDTGFKRSLQWFMDWIRAERGDAKADWLWKRMGVIIMRTLLSIMPVLSREYDQHFKSFSNVPVDRTKIGKGTTTTTGATAGEGSTEESAGVQSADGETKGAGAGESESEAEKENGQDIPRGAVAGSARNSAGIAAPNNRESASTSAAASSSAGAGPQVRGSRCFEVLGYDVMIDDALNPWVIEVNHLPSFGTDSPMDQDIKQRLMEQVFAVLPVLPDDQQAYAAHHKAESEKRLDAQNRANAAAKKEREAREQEAKEKEKEKAKPPLRPRNRGSVGGGGGSSTSEKSSASGGADETGSVEKSPPPVCTPERRAVIKEALEYIYSRHCAEKVASVDYLLNKYEHREEEFLLFAQQKYNVDLPAEYAAPPLPVPAAGVTQQQASEVSPTSGGDGRSEDGTLLSPSKSEQLLGSVGGGASAQERAHHASNRHQAREGVKRQSRSMSPIRSQSLSSTTTGSSSASGSTRRSAATWKSSDEEDSKFRAEVLAVHVPRDDDEWLLFETERLTQFTRLFPPLPRTTTATASASATAVAGAVVEAEADAEEAGAEEDESGAKSLQSRSSGKFKPASFNEIICQAFLQDRYQAMRLHNPIVSRTKGPLDDSGGSGFLPPVEAASAAKPPFSAFGSAKGIGWKAPPEPERKPAPKEPGIDQLDAAKRLSQGLSVKEVKHSVRQRTTAENALSTRYAASVVLDQQQSAAPPVRATAVIRQQMFHFDAEYRDQMLGPSTTVTTTAGGGLPGNALSAGVGGAPVVGGGSVYGGGLEAQQGSMVDDSYNVNEGRSVSNGRSFSGRRAGMNVIAPPRALVARDQSAPVLFTGRQQVPTAGNSQPSTHRFVAPTQRRSYSTHRDYDYAI